MTIDDVLSMIEERQSADERKAKWYSKQNNNIAEASYSGSVAGLALLKYAIKERLERESTEVCGEA